MSNESVPQGINRLFRAHPIRVPLILLLIEGFVVVWMLNTRVTGILLWYAYGLGMIMLATGAIMLPIGVITSVLRRRFILTLYSTGEGMGAIQGDRGAFSGLTGLGLDRLAPLRSPGIA
jgi:hypothetical protein